MVEQKTKKQNRAILILLALLVTTLLWGFPVANVQAETLDDVTSSEQQLPTQVPTERYCDLPLLPNVTSTEHFQINYDTIPEPLTIDDFTEALEAAYQSQIVEYGWAEPPLCPGDLQDEETDLTGPACLSANPWGKYPVVIDKLEGAYGYVSTADMDEDTEEFDELYYTGWLGDNPNTSATETYAKASCLVLDSDYSEEPEDTYLDTMWGTVAHEYLHAIQMGTGDPPVADEDGYPKEEDSMWYESYASYFEEEYIEDGNPSYIYLFPNMGTVELLEDPDDEDSDYVTYPVCLGQYPTSESFNYTNWPFFLHIAENFGGSHLADATNEGEAGENVTFQLWENIAQGQRGLIALENALGGQDVLQTEYHNYSIAAALMFDGVKGCGDGYVKPYCLEEGAAMGAHPEEDAGTYHPGANGEIENIPGNYEGSIADHYTANYVKIPVDSDEELSDIHLSADSCDNVALRASLVCDSGTGSTITPFPSVINAGESTTLEQQALVDCTSAYVVVTNEYDSDVEVDSCASCQYTLSMEQSPLTPEETETPEGTETPQETETPEETETPMPTETPQPPTGETHEVLATYKNSQGVPFDVKQHGFTFENYGNEDHNSGDDLNARDLFEFFGPQVCQSGNTAENCVLSGPARKWMNGQIKGSNGGHCEGMAVTSLRLFDELDFRGKQTPGDFQSMATKTADLNFPESLIENYILHYFVPQAFDEVYEATITAAPNEIVDILIRDFNKPSPIGYTVGFYFVTDKGKFTMGHAVTAYGVAKVTDNEYRILIYDNNFPGEEKYISVNRQANTWRYSTSATPGEDEEAYVGTATSENLELTPISSRDLTAGQYFTCPFCNQRNANSAISSAQNEARFTRFEYSSEGAMLIKNDAGQQSGLDSISGTVLRDIPNARLNFSKGGLGKDIPPVIDVPYIAGEELYSVFISGKDADSATDGGLTITGEGYAVGLDDVKVSADQDIEVAVSPEGDYFAFIASQATEAPNLFISYDPTSDDGVSVIFEVDGATLATDSQVSLEFDPELEFLYFKDESGSGQELEISMILIWPDSVDGSDEEVFTQTVTLPEGAKSAALDFGAWDGVLNPPLFIDDMLQNPSLNHRLTAENIVTIYNNTPSENAPTGTASVEVRFKNDSEIIINDIYFNVAQIDGENVVLNTRSEADDTKISVPNTLFGENQELDVAETFTFTFEIGLATTDTFTFSVDANGVPLEWSPSDEPFFSGEDQASLQFNVNANSLTLGSGEPVSEEEQPTALEEADEPMYDVYLPISIVQ